MVSDFKMKRLKTFKLFESGKNYDINLVKDMLLDYSDNDISVGVNEGSWILSNNPVEYIKIDIRSVVGFKIEECLFDVINYLQGCGLVLMQDSWFWYDGWQYYVGCPECLSEDIEDNYNLTSKTICHRCGHMGPADSFLVDAWPVTLERLQLAITEGKSVHQIQLIFSERSSIFLKESFNQSEVDEIKSTVGDMLLELDFQSIRSGVWVMSNVIQVELKKAVKDKSSAVIWGDRDENRSFEWLDVQPVIDGVSEYLSQWGFKPHWEEVPKLEVRANWYDGGGEDHGYDSVMYLRWSKS